MTDETGDGELENCNERGISGQLRILTSTLCGVIWSCHLISSIEGMANCELLD